MKKLFLLSGFLVISVLTACNNNSAVEGLYQESGNTINVNNQRADLNNSEQNQDPDQFGYVRHQQSGVQGKHMSIDHQVFEREKVADAISKVALSIPEVQDVSTLVTDEEVLIVYATDSKNRMETADQVKRTAMSFVPRSYHVYVSDEVQLRKNLESFSTMHSNNPKAEYALNKLIVEMKNSPQGNHMGYGENENGETNSEQNGR